LQERVRAIELEPDVCRTARLFFALQSPRYEFVAPHGSAPKPCGASYAPRRKQRASDRVSVCCCWWHVVPTAWAWVDLCIMSTVTAV